MLEEPYHLLPGKKLGPHYRIVSFLGDGWEGEVYQIEECKTGIIRAAKLFYRHRYEKLQPHVVYAKKLNKLKSCPVVIQYHHQDIARIKGQNVDFLVSDFVEGDLLSAFVEAQPQKRLTTFEALHLFYALVQGVEHIHFLGEYHGDIHSRNIIIKRKGLHFGVHLIDFLHLGKPTPKRIREDVVDLVNVLYELIGGAKFYSKAPDYLKRIICGRKHSLITKQFKSAGQLRLYLDNLDWT